MFDVVEWYVFATKTYGKCCCRKVNVNIIAKCEGKYRQVIYCCYLTVAESAATLQLTLNLKRQFYPTKVSTGRRDSMHYDNIFAAKNDVSLASYKMRKCEIAKVNMCAKVG